MLLKKKLQTTLALFVLIASFILTGCGTLNGLRKDFEEISQSLLQRNDSRGISPKETAIAACESIYRHEGTEDRYRACLKESLQKSLLASPDAREYLLYSPVLSPECRKIFQSPNGKKGDFIYCQAEAYANRNILSIVRERKNAEQKVSARNAPPKPTTRQR